MKSFLVKQNMNLHFLLKQLTSAVPTQQNVNCTPQIATEIEFLNRFSTIFRVLRHGLVHIFLISIKFYLKGRNPKIVDMDLVQLNSRLHYD